MTDQGPINQLLQWLRRNDWPLPDVGLDELTYDMPKHEVGLLRNEAVAI